MGGYTLYIQNNKLVFTYNKYGTLFTVTSSIGVPEGDVTAKVVLKKTSPVTGAATLYIGNDIVGTEQVVTTFVPTLEGLSIGRDALNPVDSAYKTLGAFDYSGVFEYVNINILPFIPTQPQAH